jgi:arylformamidase
MTRNFELIDVSHSVEDGMITYKGLPAPVISDFLSREDSQTRYAPGTEFHIGKIEMVANTGTYLDSPFHRYARGKDLAHLDLYSIANVDGIVVRCTEHPDPAITEEQFAQIDVRDKAVLVQTGWDRHWRTDEYSSGNHPFLTEGAADYLAKHGATLVGIDSFNIDATRDGIARLTQCF